MDGIHTLAFVVFVFVFFRDGYGHVGRVEGAGARALVHRELLLLLLLLMWCESLRGVRFEGVFEDLDLRERRFALAESALLALLAAVSRASGASALFAP